MSDTAVEELIVVVHGHVQGVGFRYWTVRQANRLGLTGWVANRNNGTVEILAQGSHDQIIELLRRLKSSMTPGSVDFLEREIRPPSEPYSDFSVVY